MTIMSISWNQGWVRELRPKMGRMLANRVKIKGKVIPRQTKCFQTLNDRSKDKPCLLMPFDNINKPTGIEEKKKKEDKRRRKKVSLPLFDLKILILACLRVGCSGGGD